jgi:uncharacterized protein YoxC
VLLAAFTTLDALWIGLTVLAVVLAVTLGWLLLRLAATAGRLTSFIQGLEAEALPVISRTGGTIDRVNQQLDKVDRVTDSAVDAAENVDTAVRTVTGALSRPVQRVSGLATGIAHGAASLRTRRDVRGAIDAGREASIRREHEIAEELERADEP